MKLIKNFDDYLFDFILEEKVELSIILSKKLNYLLHSVDHPISFDLLELSSVDVKSDKVAFIDYDIDNIGNFTYIIPSKVLDIYKSKYDNSVNIEKIINYDNHNLLYYTSAHLDDVWSKSRMSTSINKVVNKIFPNKYKASGDPGNDLESFKNMVIAQREKLEKIFDRIKVVGGSDLNKYYSQYNYDMTYGKGPLTQSCMRYDSINFFMNFYSKNGVKLVILFSDKNPDKIIGRALLWDIEYINDEKVDRKFMDRIYTIKDNHIDVFKEYARKNGWLFKKQQNMDNNGDIIDPLNNSVGFLSLRTKPVFNYYEDDYYPYMDTMKFYYIEEGILSNTNKYEDDGVYGDYIYLADTDGGPNNSFDLEDEEIQYIEYYNNWYNEDDLVWCELGEEFRLPEDAILIEDDYDSVYATQEYASEYLMYSDFLDRYLRFEDAVYSEFQKSYINIHNSVVIFKQYASNYDLDYIIDEEKYNDYIDSDRLQELIEYDMIIPYDNNMFFNYKDIDNFVFCKKLSGGTGYYHKKWDKDKIFITDEEYYYNDSERSFKNYEMDAIFPFKK